MWGKSRKILFWQMLGALLVHFFISKLLLAGPPLTEEKKAATKKIAYEKAMQIKTTLESCADEKIGKQAFGILLMAGKLRTEQEGGCTQEAPLSHTGKTVQQLQSPLQYSVLRSFVQEISKEKIMEKLTAYWMHKGLYETALPESFDAALMEAGGGTAIPLSEKINPKFTKNNEPIKGPVETLYNTLRQQLSSKDIHKNRESLVQEMNQTLKKIHLRKQLGSLYYFSVKYNPKISEENKTTIINDGLHSIEQLMRSGVKNRSDYVKALQLFDLLFEQKAKSELDSFLSQQGIDVMSSASPVDKLPNTPDLIIKGFSLQPNKQYISFHDFLESQGSVFSNSIHFYSVEASQNPLLLTHAMQSNISEINYAQSHVPVITDDAASNDKNKTISGILNDYQKTIKEDLQKYTDMMNQNNHKSEKQLLADLKWLLERDPVTVWLKLYQEDNPELISHVCAAYKALKEDKNWEQTKERIFLAADIASLVLIPVTGGASLYIKAGVAAGRIAQASRAVSLTNRALQALSVGSTGLGIVQVADAYAEKNKSLAKHQQFYAELLSRKIRDHRKINTKLSDELLEELSDQSLHELQKAESANTQFVWGAATVVAGSAAHVVHRFTKPSKIIKLSETKLSNIIELPVSPKTSPARSRISNRTQRLFLDPEDLKMPDVQRVPLKTSPRSSGGYGKMIDDLETDIAPLLDDAYEANPFLNGSERTGSSTTRGSRNSRSGPVTNPSNRIVSSPEAIIEFVDE